MEKVIRSNKELGAALRMARKAKSMRQVDVARRHPFVRRWYRIWRTVRPWRGLIL